MSKHGRVLVAMSGGVDSSVAAVLLKEEGYEVVGITMKTWDYAQSAPSSTGKQIGCCTLESMNDARAVGIKHDFTHFIIDIREEFGDWVIDTFTEEYLSGRTPNPCVLCNTYIKWAALMRRADALDCEFIATGHYARLRHDRSLKRHVLMRGLDTNKDQSYALWGVKQEHFARTLLPLGIHRKPHIRKLAADFGLLQVADKPDSYEICFVPDNDYRRFLRDRVPDLDQRVGPGPMVHEDGTALGEHQGYPFYTIGQRHGLGLALGYPAYVTRIDAETNTVTVGPVEALDRQKLRADGLNLIKYDELIDTHHASAKVRYKDPGSACLVRQDGADAVEVEFLSPRKAITPGQAVVMYEEDDVLGGAWIREVEEPVMAG
ncbi:MAG: tRNA 2-thiouridine(34) synthase MnmA [Rhodothermales bacterium]|nr:tRNA 2-thiouridine(34) synthase MnmA [Rhodothermales bacterium]MBO6779388.1 tRNA 2-thiouridine(34) synthase MnmA [Rhodothermales bacterium]